MMIVHDLTPVLNASSLEGWVAFMRDAGPGEERIGHVLADHRENDVPETAAWQLASMRSSGFEFAEVIWRWEKFALFYAERRRAA